MTFQLKTVAMWVLVASTLSGCGGGGAGGSDTSATTPTNTATPNSGDTPVSVTNAPTPSVTPVLSNPVNNTSNPSQCQIAGVPSANPVSTSNIVPNIQDPTATAALVNNMLLKYDDFINNNPCDNWFYFPDDPREMTAADWARFKDPNFWPVELKISDEYPAESLEAMRRAMNFMRYAVHTKAFAQILKEKIILDRGQIVDYREVLLAIRAMDYPITIQVNKTKTVNDNAWYATVRDAVVKGVRIPPAGSIPSNFDPTFAMPDTGALVTPSPRFTGPAAASFVKSYDSADQMAQVLGMGATSFGLNRKWFNYGVDIVILQLLPHEVLHVVGYSHSGLDATNTANWPKNASGQASINGTPISDVNYAVGMALSDLYGVYFGYKNIDFQGKYNYNFVNPKFVTYSATDAKSSQLDSLGLPKWQYNTTENMYFPMNYYGAPYISKASSVTDGFKRNFGDVAYAVNNLNSATWKNYVLGKTAIQWNCDGSTASSSCIGTPDSRVAANVNYFGQNAYFTTSAQWTLSSPNNNGSGLVN